MKTNPTKVYMPARAGTASMLILGVLLMGCDKDPPQHNDKALMGQVSKPAPSEEEPDRDWSQPYQIMPIGDALIKIPRGYLIRRDYGDGNSKGLNEHMKLQASIVLTPKGKPEFLTNEEVQKKFYPSFLTPAEIQKKYNRKGEPPHRTSAFDTYNIMYIDVYKREFDFKDAVLFDEQRLLENYFGVDQPASPYILAGGLKGYSRVEHDIILADLGLKAHRHVTDVKENGVIIKSLVTKIIYFPLDTNFKMPNGSAFYLNCDPAPTDPKESAHCDTNFMPRRDRIEVRYSFPPQHLRHWKEIHQFVLNTLQFTN